MLQRRANSEAEALQKVNAAGGKAVKWRMLYRFQCFGEHVCPRVSVLSFENSDLSDESLSELMPQLKQFRQLEGLNLAGTRITDKALRLLGEEMSFLIELHLARTQVTDDGVRHLAKFRGLVYLDLSETAVTEHCMDDLVPLRYLRCLYVNGFSDEWWRELYRKAPWLRPKSEPIIII
jgi:hypothetical protein